MRLCGAPHKRNNWGFLGGGARQAGLALLADVIGEHDALPLLPFFVEEVVANFRLTGFYITAEAIEKWAEIVVRECGGELPPLRDGYS
ncbi:DUF6166 domain-containing protein [Frigoriglobus tundricola]|uniref:Uncharacterized protein n=1 Tax=Frigoriglobus tundricola TaxID=2774151 RepID=A0A6M5Z431_9BACT|nr:DUF6166 domain-containing protein [Frigoriglobus tundricola]QJX01158.1 hypothetical protein FTUN_8797 [Frigoriglobus tundricola]